MNCPQLTVAMREAVGIQLRPLAELVKSDVELRKGTASDPVQWLDKLAALFRDVDARAGPQAEEHPCLPALADAWPVIRDVMEK